MSFKVEIRDNCKICGGALPNSRYRTYCSDTCRNKRNNQKQNKSNYNRDWQRRRSAKIASVPDPENKCQCLICGGWYVQVCSHVYYIHGMTGREYREYFELEVKKGIVPEWYRKLKGKQAMDNKTFENLKKGAQFRFKKGGEGVGVYKRSPVTMEKLKKLHTFNKKK